MKAEALKPQMTQMNADAFLNAFICAYLRHPRLTKTAKAIAIRQMQTLTARSVKQLEDGKG